MKNLESLLPLPARSSLIRFLPALACLVVATACGGSSKSNPSGADGGTDNETDFKGTYTVRGETFQCDVSTQDFPSTGEYSVVCQNDDDGLVQVTFKDEDSARAPGPFTVTVRDIFEHPDATTVDVSYMPFGDGMVVDSQDDATGTVAVTSVGANARATLTDVSLVSADDSETQTVSATLNY